MESFLTDLNKQQLDKGLRSDNTLIGTYSNATYRISESKGRPKLQSEINLLDTGSFRTNFVSKVVGNFLSMESIDSKTSMLEAKYGESIFGLPDDKKQIVADKLIDILSIKITDLLKNA